MKRLGRWAALIGLVATVWLVARDNPRAVFALLRTAGPLLLLVALIRILPMLTGARNWQILVLDGKRPGLAAMMFLEWIRESINGLLPVARIGGEIVAFRLLRRRGVAASAAAASLIADGQVTVIGQLLLTLAGVGVLLSRGAAGSIGLARNLGWGALALAPLFMLLAFVQHAKPVERITRLLNQVVGGKLASRLGDSAAIDEETKRIWRQPGLIVASLLFWQPLFGLGAALEIWFALYALHARASLADAFVLASLIQGISSAAFFIPAGLGAQEGGFLLVGHALGLDAPTCLALAGSRRLRDLLVFVPGLVAWHVSESGEKIPSDPADAPS